MERLNPLLILWVGVLLASPLIQPGLAQAQSSGEDPQPVFSGEIPEAFESDDEDLQIADTYFALELASSATIAGFGVGAVVGGVESFILAASFGGQAGSQHLFSGLTLVSLGSASLVSGITGIDSSQRSWTKRRRALWRAGPVERRLLREREIDRLRRRARSHAMGIAADGTFLGLGIVMSLLGPPGQALPLVLNGAFVLGLDIFQLVLDDQTARVWERRNVDSAAGFFGKGGQPRAPRILALGFSPLPSRPGSGAKSPGLSFSLAGVF